MRHMNRAIVVLMLLFLATFGVGQSKENPCWKTAKSQMELNHCAYQDEQDADAELNLVYQQLMMKLKDDDNATQKVRAAQRAWMAFRDARLEEAFPAPNKSREYGSMYPMCRASVDMAMTKERTAQLRRMLGDDDECGEAPNP